MPDYIIRQRDRGQAEAKASRRGLNVTGAKMRRKYTNGTYDDMTTLLVAGAGETTCLIAGHTKVGELGDAMRQTYSDIAV